MSDFGERLRREIEAAEARFRMSWAERWRILKMAWQALRGRQ